MCETYTIGWLPFLILLGLVGSVTYGVMYIWREVTKAKGPPARPRIGCTHDMRYVELLFDRPLYLCRICGVYRLGSLDPPKKGASRYDIEEI
jgi:hypothetical protein